jgi:hypothetical protein
VRASDGKLLETWTGAVGAFGVLAAMGRIFVCGSGLDGNLYMIDPREPAGLVTTVSDSIGDLPRSIAFDGKRLWTANLGGVGSVSIITPGPTLPWEVTVVSNGFVGPSGILFDGSNIWVTDQDNTIKRLDSNGMILQVVELASATAGFPTFDGVNIWVPTTGTLTVVRAATGSIIATLPNVSAWAGAFDGERVLIANRFSETLSLWKASDLTQIAFYEIGPEPRAVCSDGVNFWIAFSDGIARF